MKFKIEKKISIPDKYSDMGQPKYPFHKMKVGDSFFSPVKVFSAHHSYMQKNKKNNFSLRRWRKKGIDGVRVWRTK